MGRLLVLFLALPWWVYFPLAGGAVWLGERAHYAALETEAERAAALGASAPDAVDIGQFDLTTDRHLADEITVRGWIDADLNYELVQTAKGVTTARRYMYMLFGEDDPAGHDVVRGAMVLTEAERDAFVDMLDNFWIDYSRNGFIFEINGFGKTNAALDSLAFDAIEEKGLTKAADFVFVEPFLDGRDAALAPRAPSQDSRRMFWLVASALVLLGTVKRVFSVLFKKHEGDEPDPEADIAETAAAAAPLGHVVGANTPLGRLTGVREAQALEAQEPLVYTALPDEDESPWELAPDPDPEAAPEEETDLADAAVVAREEAGFAPLEPADESVDVDPDVAQTPAKGSSDIAFFVRMALAMVFVGTLTYDPSMALGLLSVVAPAALVLIIVWRVLRMVGQRRAPEVS